MTVFVHIGYHKTGSTAVQAALRTLTPRLAEAGVEVPGGLSSWLGHPELAWVFETCRHSWADRAYTIDEVAAAYRPVLDAAARQRRHVLLSSEEFCRLDFCREGLHALAAFLRPYDVRIIGFVRDPLDFLLSRWRHESQMGAEQRSLTEFLMDEDTLLSADFERRTRAWLIAFGDRCSFRDYATDMAEHGSVVTALLREVGVMLPASAIPSSLCPERKLHPMLCDAAQLVARSALPEAAKGAAFERLFALGETLPQVPLRELLQSHPLPPEVDAVLAHIRHAMVNRGLLPKPGRKPVPEAAAA